mmetsp:Transcript_33752/g.96566  ORF Transcript_33752/g.96566 Transcript_33752/m.96566 type:complete len:418 (-) Transcript_33752:8-1261(-)
MVMRRRVHALHVEPDHADALVESPAGVRPVWRLHVAVEPQPGGEHVCSPQIPEARKLWVLRQHWPARHGLQSAHADGEDNLVGLETELLAARRVPALDAGQLAATLGLDDVCDTTARAEADVAALLHLPHPRLEDLLADVTAAPADVECVLPLQHKEIRHAQRGSGAALLPRRKQPREDHRLEGLVVKLARHSQLGAEIPERHAVEFLPRLRGIVELAEGQDQRCGGGTIQRRKIREPGEESLSKSCGQFGLIAVDRPDGFQPLGTVLPLFLVTSEGVLIAAQAQLLVNELEDVVVLVPETMDASLHRAASRSLKTIVHQAARTRRRVDYSDVNVGILGQLVRRSEAAPASSYDYDLLAAGARTSTAASTAGGSPRQRPALSTAAGDRRAPHPARRLGHLERQPAQQRERWQRGQQP